MRRISGEKRVGKFKAATRMVRSVRPRVAVPFAGPPCFLDPELLHHNDSIPDPGIFPDTDQAAAWLEANIPGQEVRTFLPGDVYEPSTDRCERDPRWEGFTFGDAAAYLESYAEARITDINSVAAGYPDPDENLGERFAEHFARLGELSPYFLERIAMTVRFEVEGAGGGRWDVHLGPDRVRADLAGRASEVQYRFRVASRWLAPVIDGILGWEDLLLSLRFTAWRHPDLYNDYLVGLLKHADPDALAAVERYERRRPDETVIITSGDRDYEISRFCPHAGEDLTEGAVVIGNRLRCLGHNFEFDLETGRCVNARCDPIATRLLERERA
jgi:UDP-MurNAc hydroxylase